LIYNLYELCTSAAAETSTLRGKKKNYKLFFQNGTAFSIPFHFLQHYNGKGNLSDFSHILMMLVM